MEYAEQEDVEEDEKKDEDNKEDSAEDEKEDSAEDDEATRDLAQAALEMFLTPKQCSYISKEMHYMEEYIRQKNNQMSNCFYPWNIDRFLSRSNRVATLLERVFSDEELTRLEAFHTRDRMDPLLSVTGIPSVLCQLVLDYEDHTSYIRTLLPVARNRRKDIRESFVFVEAAQSEIGSGPWTSPWWWLTCGWCCRRPQVLDFGCVRCTCSVLGRFRSHFCYFETCCCGPCRYTSYITCCALPRWR